MELFQNFVNFFILLNYKNAAGQGFFIKYLNKNL